MSRMQLFYRFSKRLSPILFLLGGVSVNSRAADDVESNENYWFKSAYESFQKKDYDGAEKSFEEGLKYAKELKPYYHFYQGQIAIYKGQTEAGINIFRNVISESNSPRLRTQVLQQLIEQELNQKQFDLAQTTLKKYRKYLISRGDRPLLNYIQARIFKHIRNQGKMCEALRNLYSKYPDSSYSAKWSYELEKNEFLGAPTGCTASLGEFKERIRNLLWAGLDEKASTEVNAMATRQKAQSPAVSDSLLAAFYVQEGEIGRAYDLLAPHYQNMKHDPEFLSQYAFAAARKGDSDTAYNVFYEIHKMYGKSKTGRRALFQAAFLSYQFNNYERSAAAFKEFIQKYPRSGLRKDAEWHLAWLEYLRGNFDTAIKGFKRQLDRRSPAMFEKAQYWLAMSYLRNGEFGFAQKLFAELSKDPMKSYYSLAARFRLKSIPTLSPKQKTMSLMTRPMIAARSFYNYIKPYDLGSYEESSEHEEELTFSPIDNDTRDTDEAPTTPDDMADEQAPEIILPSQGNVVARAQLFKSLGLDDYARDELQRFDRRKKDKKFLEEVWREFDELHLYNYSSELARGVFSDLKNSKNQDDVQNFYLKTYPRAFEKEVSDSAKSFKLKPEFIWAIMRTETQYKQDAISPVGALGLMQVMPLTGRKMAEKIGLKNFEPSQLLEPATGIKIGTSYLQRLSSKFVDEIPLVAAAYNAGPHRVKLWVSSVGTRDWDEFIDHIPFLETRNYVKRVVLSYQIYLWSQTKNFDESLDLSKPFQFKMTEPVPLKETWEDI